MIHTQMPSSGMSMLQYYISFLNILINGVYVKKYYLHDCQWKTKSLHKLLHCNNCLEIGKKINEQHIFKDRLKK